MTDWGARHETERRQDLAALRFRWDGAYQFWYFRGWWGARRVDARMFADMGSVILASTPGALDESVYRDYHKNPVPRDVVVVSSAMFW